MKSAELATPVKPMRRVIPFRRAHERRGEELAFLPAALEIVETPPSPIGRAIASTIILLFCAALVWAWWGTIDIVASASGKIVPSGRTKVIQPFETGVVRSIRVEDGQAVKAGDVLIELDPTVNAAERDHLRSDLLAEQLNIARLRAALAAGDDPLADFTPPAEADPALLRTQRQLLLHQVAEHRAKIAALGRQQAQKEAEHATTSAAIHKLETTIPVVQQRVDIRKTLMDKELGSKLSYFSKSCNCCSSNKRNSAYSGVTGKRRKRPSRQFARRDARRRPNIGARSQMTSRRPSRRRTVSPRT
jgi:membrane fusion protein, hemolysin D